MAVKYIKIWKHPVVLFGLLILVLGIGAASIYVYNQKDIPKDELAALQQQLSAVIELPKEPPTFATVSDVNKLKDQAFFANARNGDKVLIYPIAKKAILFRPSTGKIIDVGPITVNAGPTPPPVTPTNPPTGGPSPSLTPAVTASQTATITIAIYNGTGKSGLARTTEEQLKKTFPAGRVISKKDAKGVYEKSIVVDVNKKYSSQTAALAKATKATAAALPKDEIAPKADLLLILGNDYLQ